MNSLPKLHSCRSFRWIGVLCVLFFSAFVCGATPVALEVRLVDQKGRPVEDAVVSLVPLEAAVPAASAAPAPVEVVQKAGDFRPLVTAVRVGTTVTFINRDDVQHHVYSVSPTKPFEIPLHGGPTEHGERFDRTGVVTIGCNIHDWMLSYVVVLDTPWFVRSDATGVVKLADVPPGRYRCEVWHPRLGQVEQRELALAAGAPPVEFALKLRPDRRPRRSLEGQAAGYR